MTTRRSGSGDGVRGRFVDVGGESEPQGDRGSLRDTVLLALPAKQRESVIHHYLGGLPYAEVGELLGTSTDAARRSAADGIAALRRTYARGTRC